MGEIRKTKQLPSKTKYAVWGTKRQVEMLLLPPNPAKYCSGPFNSHFSFYFILEVVVLPPVLNSTFYFNKLFPSARQGPQE